MAVQARVTSKGQVTIPASIRRRLGIQAGSRLTFRVEEDDVMIQGPDDGPRAHLDTIPDFFELAGSVAVPEELRGASWAEVRSSAWEEQAKRRSR